MGSKASAHLGREGPWLPGWWASLPGSSRHLEEVRRGRDRGLATCDLTHVLAAGSEPKLLRNSDRGAQTVLMVKTFHL